MGAVKRAKPGEGMRYRNQATELSRTKDNRLTTREKKNAAVTETAAETNLESKSKKSKSKIEGWGGPGRSGVAFLFATPRSGASGRSLTHQATDFRAWFWTSNRPEVLFMATPLN